MCVYIDTIFTYIRANFAYILFFTYIRIIVACFDS